MTKICEHFWIRSEDCLGAESFSCRDCKISIAKYLSLLRQENRRYKAALEVYGNKDNWSDCETNYVVEKGCFKEFGYELSQDALKNE